MTPVPVRFRPRESPLEPVAAIATGESARALARRLLEFDDAALRSLRAVAGPLDLLVFGRADELPWVDGILYLGVDPVAPLLLLPTSVRPDVPLDLFERAIRANAAPSPTVVVPHPPRALSFGDAHPIERARLQAWLERGA